MKKAKGKTKTDGMLFLKFSLALLVIHAYYLANYLLERKAVKTTTILG